jgi:(R,R)-butanediol dehydrogenase/meso-butanediol dehydrogenase/diacetyl reductase
MRRGGLEAGEHVVVIGGGPIGLGAVQAAVAGGAGRVHLVEPVASRRRLGERFGAVGVTPEELGELRGPRGDAPALIVDCVALPETMQASIELLPSGGRLVVVGVSLAPIAIDFNEVMLQEKSIIGTAGRRHEEDFPTLIDLVDRGVVDLDSMITSRIAVEEIVERGFEAMINDRESQVKILASPIGADR